MKPEGTAATTANTAIKCEMKGETKVNEKETEAHQTTDCAIKKQLPYTDKEVE